MADPDDESSRCNLSLVRKQANDWYIHTEDAELDRQAIPDQRIMGTEPTFAEYSVAIIKALDYLGALEKTKTFVQLADVVAAYTDN